MDTFYWAVLEKIPFSSQLGSRNPAPFFVSGSAKHSVAVFPLFRRFTLCFFFVLGIDVDLTLRSDVSMKDPSEIFNNKKFQYSKTPLEVKLAIRLPNRPPRGGSEAKLRNFLAQNYKVPF